MFSRNWQMIALVSLVIMLGVGAWGLLADHYDVAPADPSAQVPPQDSSGQPSDLDSSRVDRHSAKTNASETKQLRIPVADSIVIRGRCIAAENGQPLSACEVHLSGSGGGVANSAWEDTRITKKDGVFEFRVDSDAGIKALQLQVKREQRAIVFGTLEKVRAGQFVDLGDVGLRRGYSLAARVVDETGKPFANAEVYLSCDPPKLDPWSEINGYFAFSAQDGWVDFTDLWFPADTWKVEVQNAPALIRPKQFVIRGGETQSPLEIVVRSVNPADTISGVVVDERQQPVAEAAVSIYAGDGRSKTATDGTFRVFRGDNQDKDSEVKLRARADGFESFKSGSLNWGTTDVRITLRRVFGLEVRVSTAADQLPVEDFSLRCFPVWGDGWNSICARKRLKGRHKNGKVMISDLAIGRHMLVVHPETTDLLPSLPIFFYITTVRPPPMDVELQLPTEYPIEVVFSDGKPVVGTKVEMLLSPAQREMGEYTKIRDLATAFEKDLSIGSYRSNWVFRVAVATSDEKGKAILRWQPSPMQIVLRALGPGHTPVERVVVLTPTPQRIRLVVTKDAKLVGKLGPRNLLEQLGEPRGVWAKQLRQLVAEGKASQKELDSARKEIWPGLILQEVGGEGRSIPAGYRLAEPVPIKLDGSFAIAGIPPGTWELFLRKIRFDLDGGGGSRINIHPPLATVTLASGETKQLEIDLKGKVELATLTIKVTLNGKLLPGVQLNLETGNPDHRGGVDFAGSGPTPKADLNGMLTLTQLDPMFYRVQVYVRDSGRKEQVKLPGFDWLRLAPGQHAHRDIDLVTTAIKIQVLLADGKTPVEDRKFTLINREETSSTEATTDASGWLVLDPPPASPFYIDTWPKKMLADLADMSWREREKHRIRLGPIQMDLGKEDVVLKLRMPEGKK